MARVKSSVTTAIAEAVGTEDFVVIELTKDGSPKPVYDAHGELLKFRSGAEAARVAREMTKPGGPKYQPRRVKDDKWMDRERRRFASKEYQELPWSNAVWWRNHSHIHQYHFPHVSTKNSVGLMAFTESDEKGSADVQTAIKPGKYLERYFGDILDPYIIRDLCTVFSNKFEDNCLLFGGDTEDEMEQLYTSGPSSCMSHPKDKYTSHIHPVRVYAAGDLKLAYMKRDGRIVARSLVYPDKKLYSRIYGDAGRIEPLLQKAGYKKGPPVGARLLRVMTWQDKVRKSGNRAFVLPHIDDISYTLDTGEFLCIGDPSQDPKKFKNCVRLGGAAGLSEWIFTVCQCCDKETERGTMVEVITDDDGNRRRYCPSCVEKHTVLCSVSKIPVRRDQAVEMHDGKMWWRRQFTDRGFTCAGNSKRYPLSEQVAAKDARGRVQRYSKEYFKANGGRACKLCGNQSLGDCSETCKTRYHKDREAYEGLMWSSSTNVFVTRRA